jgi:hypothetical protein
VVGGTLLRSRHDVSRALARKGEAGRVRGADALYEAPMGSWPCYSAGMDRRARLTKELKEAERELEAASRLCDVRAAAKKLNRARIELQWLDDEEKPKRRVTRGRGSAASSS